MTARPAAKEEGLQNVIRPVLIVEDDRKIARVVAIYLEQAGYRVVSAASGKDALAAAAKELPLLVVLDLMLLENHPGPENADAGDDPGRQSRGIRPGEGTGRDHGKGCCAQGDERMRAFSCRLTGEFPLHANQETQKRGQQ